MLDQRMETNWKGILESARVYLVCLELSLCEANSPETKDGMEAYHAMATAYDKLADVST